MFDMLAVKETFRKRMSERLGMEFVINNVSPSFLFSIEASPDKSVADEDLLRGLEDCLGTMDLELDRNSKRLEGKLIWYKFGKLEDNLSLGISNLAEPVRIIIITVTSML